jgi:hypothetical protein
MSASLLPSPPRRLHARAAAGPRVELGWERLRRVLEIHRAALSALPGVLGTGVGYRRRAGRLAGEPCVTVYVRRKRAPEALLRAGAVVLPERLHARGTSVPVDVVEAGALRRNLACGARVGSHGLGPGDRWGTLGMVARDRASGRPVAITAMHLTGRAAHPPGEPLRFSAVDRAGECPVPLGELLAGTTLGVDAAKISIDAPGGVSALLPGVGLPGPARAVAGTDLRTGVQLYGARSGYQPGFVTDLWADFPGEGLTGAFLVAMRCGRGDSGAVCCDVDGAVLGLHVGSLRAAPLAQVFCPILPALEALSCEG